MPEAGGDEQDKASLENTPRKEGKY